MNPTVDIDDVLARIIDEQERQEPGADTSVVPTPRVPISASRRSRKGSFAPARALSAMAAERSRIKATQPHYSDDQPHETPAAPRSAVGRGLAAIANALGLS